MVLWLWLSADQCCAPRPQRCMFENGRSLASMAPCGSREGEACWHGPADLNQSAGYDAYRRAGRLPANPSRQKRPLVETRVTQQQFDSVNDDFSDGLSSAQLHVSSPGFCSRNPRGQE
ncbi:unnamed protein product [Diplocarpon coronariae]